MLSDDTNKRIRKEEDERVGISTENQLFINMTLILDLMLSLKNEKCYIGEEKLLESRGDRDKSMQNHWY